MKNIILLLSIIAVVFIFSCEDEKDAHFPDIFTGSYSGNATGPLGDESYILVLAKTGSNSLTIQNISGEGRSTSSTIQANSKTFNIPSQPFGSGVLISGTGIIEGDKLTLSVEFNSADNTPWHASEVFVGKKSAGQ